MRIGGFTAVLVLAVVVHGAPTTRPTTHPVKGLAGYRTPATAIKTTIKSATTRSAGQVGYLGIGVMRDPAGRIVIETVDGASPAGTAGLREGDLVSSINGRALRSAEDLEDVLLGKLPDETLKVTVTRDGKNVEMSVTLAAASRPFKPMSGQRVVLGVQFKDVAEGVGALIDRVMPDQPGAKAGLKPGDVILDIDGVAVMARETINDQLSSRAPDDVVSIKVKRADKIEELKVKLVADPATRESGGRERSGPWKKPVYRMAIVCIDFADAKHNEKITPAAWEDALLSKGTYAKTSATGQPVFGSVNDLYTEMSAGQFKIEGKAFAHVDVSKKRSDYGLSVSGAAKTSLLNEALDKLLERDGKTALDGFDGICFVYSGERINTNRGNLYWPHKGNFTYQGKRVSYFICQEGGAKMTNISVYAHEFGHMIGLADLYARPENPGSEGLGNWCLMSNQLSNGRPQHMGAWCKEQLGWLTPAVIDPSVKQKLVLSPIEGSKDQAFKVLVKPDGSEYFLLEVRKKTGFDQDLPGEGLLVWRVVGNRPFLEESHGVEGPTGPRSYLREVPFPSTANRAFTPYTTPSSRGLMGGGASVFITNIERLPDGRVTFHVGYEYF